MWERIKQLDQAAFALLNQDLAHPWLDRLVPLFHPSAWFVASAMIASAALIWFGRRKGLICVTLIGLNLVVGDGLICRSLKALVDRPRPHAENPAAILRQGKGGHGSLPSSHVANWAAAALVLAFFYRRSLLLLVPLTVVIGFFRVYSGAHYPGDVLAGAALGVLYSLLLLLLALALLARVGVMVPVAPNPPPSP